MPKSGLNVALKGLDDIFSTEESRQDEQREQVQQIPVIESSSRTLNGWFLNGKSSLTMIP